MRSEDYITKMATSHKDQFVRALFVELNKRLENFENGKEMVEKINVSSIVFPSVVMFLIIVNLFIQILL